MAQDLFDYPKMVEAALRGVVREALGAHARGRACAATTTSTSAFAPTRPGSSIPDYLRAKYPDEMTIVLQHQFWALEVGDEGFSVTLSFQNRSERLTIPFAAITTFADPSVNFGLQFEAPGRRAGRELAALPATVRSPERAEAGRAAAGGRDRDARQFRKR